MYWSMRWNDLLSPQPWCNAHSLTQWGLFQLGEGKWTTGLKTGIHLRKLPKHAFSAKMSTNNC